MAAGNPKINISNISKNHNGLNVFNRLINDAFCGSNGQKYATSGRQPNALPIEFNVTCFPLINDERDLKETIQLVKTDLKSYEKKGKRYKFSFVMSNNDNRAPNCKILTFYMLNPNNLSEAIWNNKLFISNVKYLWITFVVAYENDELIRDPNTHCLFSVNSGKIGFQYRTTLHTEIESEAEAINFITNEVEKMVTAEGSIATGFVVKTTVSLNKTDLNLSVYIE